MNDTNQLDISKIFADPKQPRQHFNKQELLELKESIKAKGIYVPLTIESNYNGDNYLLLDGERRYRCAKELDLKTVPVSIITGPLSFEERTVLRFHIQEQHKNWSLFDKAKAVYDLKKETRLSIQELAVKLNTNAPTVHHWLSIVDFSPDSQEEILDKKISFTYLFHLSKITKDYLSICDISRRDIEHKLIEKTFSKTFSSILELQRYSKLMSTYDYVEEKIKFLNDEKMTLESLLKDTSTKKAIDLEIIYKQMLNLNKSIANIKSKKHELTKDHIEMLKTTTDNIQSLLKEYQK